MTVDTRSTQELLPWLVPLSEGIVVCKDSSLLACFEFTGVDYATVGDIERDVVSYAAERLMTLFRDLPVTLWWTVRRERTEDYPKGDIPDAVFKMMDDANRKTFETNAGFRNRHFFSVIHQPVTGTDSFISKVGAMSADGMKSWRAVIEACKATFFGTGALAWRASEIEAVLTEFEQKLEQISSVMADCQFVRLINQDMLGFLWAMSNPGLPMTPKLWNGRTFLDAYLSETPISVERGKLLFGDIAPTHVTAVSMKDWPESLAFGAFSTLTSLPVELVVSHCFRVQSTAETLKHIDSVKAVNDMLMYPLKAWVSGMLKRSGDGPTMNNPDPSRARASAEATAAKGAVNGGDVIFGYHNLTVLIIGRTEDEAENFTRHLLRMMHASPFIGAVRESIHLLSGFATTLPGNWTECRRWLTLSSANMVDIAPLEGVLLGERENEHLTKQLGKRCEAMTALPTDMNTPFYFNFHSGALGHTMVIGPSRTGKSVGMNFLLSQSRRYGDATRIVIFDRDYSCKIPTLLQGGDHMDLSSGQSIKLNPFMMIGDGEADRRFLVRWIEDRITARGAQVSAKDAKQISEAVEQMAALQDRNLCRLKTISTYLDTKLKLELAEWIEGGTYGTYFDNVEDSFDLSNFIAIEMGKIMEDPKIARAFMDYAFYRIMKRLQSQLVDGGSMAVTIIYLEEAGFLMSDEHFAAKLRDWLKTFAKLNALVILTTQSLEDMTEVSESQYAAIRDNILTRIFLPNPNAASAALRTFYSTRFALTDGVIDRIAHMRPRLDYLVVKPGVVRCVQIPLTAQQLAVCRSDTAAQRIFSKHYNTRAPGWEFGYINEVVEKL
jgi:type IV secretion/conjugal transfer VirB4 family ATPase